MTKNVIDQIMKDATLDYKVGFRLVGINDLIAVEAKYRLICLRALAYVALKIRSDIMIYHQNQKSSQGFRLSQWCVSLKNFILQQRRDGYSNWMTFGIGMSSLLKILEIVSPSHTRSTFKEHLQSQVGTLFDFFFLKPLDRSVSERQTLLIPIKYQHASTVAEENEGLCAMS